MLLSKDNATDFPCLKATPGPTLNADSASYLPNSPEVRHQRKFDFCNDNGQSVAICLVSLPAVVTEGECVTVISLHITLLISDPSLNQIAGFLKSIPWGLPGLMRHPLLESTPMESDLSGTVHKH